MRFYTEQHRHYCGIDLHARTRCTCASSMRAFSEAAALFLRANPIGQSFFRRLERKHGKGKAMSVLAAKLGRAVYFMCKRHQPFDLDRFVAA